MSAVWCRLSGYDWKHTRVEQVRLQRAKRICRIDVEQWIAKRHTCDTHIVSPVRAGLNRYYKPMTAYPAPITRRMSCIGREVRFSG